MKKYTIIILVAASTLFHVGCKKFLDLKPIDAATENTFYVDEKGLQGGIVSCYDALQSNNLYGANFLTLAEIRSDNVIDNNPGAGGGVRNQIDVFTETSANENLSNAWQGFYTAIYRCNIIIDRAPSVQMDTTRKAQIIGQAYFIRALAYFNLTRLWGKVPLITKVQTITEARNNQRSDTAAIYQQIVLDLKAAQSMLPIAWASAERGRATSYAAIGLLGKVHLYQKNYSLASSTLVPLVTAIYSGSIVSTVPQTNTFPTNLKTSKDVIFAIQYLAGGVGEFAHQNNRYRNQDNNNVISLPQSLFETGDNRKALVAPTTVNATRPGKFNAPAIGNETSGDFPIVRCADVLLIYAEALNEIGYGNADAFKALNAVRINAGIPEKTNIDLPTQSSFRDAVYNERRLELALECDRWFDLVRTNQMATVFPLVSGFRRLYPIPQPEIENVNNPSDWQNPGY
jgi:hypothetical protein